MPDDSRESDEGRAGTPNGAARERRIPERAVGFDAVFRVLDDPRRRYLLYALEERSEWELADLAARVAAWEADAPEGAVDEDDRTRVYTALFHVHLPVLRDHDVVRFDPDAERVAAGEDAERIQTALAAVGAALGDDDSTADPGSGSDSGHEEDDG